jgi:RNA methyltransferase, TrmH family
MHKSMLITSAQNPKIKQLVKLRDKRTREKEQSFLIEGYREILRAVQSGYPIETLFICKDLFLGSNEPELINKAGGVVYELTEGLFRKCSYRDRPDGLLAIAPIQRKTMEQFKTEIAQRAGEKPWFLLLAESIEKPGNLGSILRSCDAAGVHGVIVCDKQADVFNPNVVRASIGTLFTVPVVECDVQEALELCKTDRMHLVAATPYGKQVFTDVDLKKSVVIAMGSEQLGLSDTIMKEADMQVRIPMLGQADSLNVAAATTLLLYEVVRQRGVV